MYIMKNILFFLFIVFCAVTNSEKVDLEKKVDKINQFVIDIIYYYERRLDQIKDEIGKIEFNISYCQYHYTYFDKRIARLENKIT